MRVKSFDVNIFIFSKWTDMFKRFKKGRSGYSQELISNSVSKPTSSTHEGHNRGNPRTGRERIKIDLLIHDLKVPLSVIEAGIISLLRRPERYGPLTEKQEKVLRRVLRNTKVTKTLVNDTLELGRSREGIVNIANFKLSSLIEQTFVEIFDLAHGSTSEKIKGCTNLIRLRETLEEKGILLYVDEDLWCSEVCLDVAKVTQILRNLLNNALKYRKNKVELGLDKKEGHFILFVKDDGEGIPEDCHENIAGVV